MHENCQSSVPGMNVCLQGVCPCADVCMKKDTVTTVLSFLKDMQTHELLQVLHTAEMLYYRNMHTQNYPIDFEDIPF